MTHNLCADRGTLADVRFPIPVDANTFAYKGIDRVVPCSHLRCASCEVALKWLDGRRIEGGPSALAAAWDADDTTRSAGAVETDAGWRFYFCRCQSFLCITAVSLHLAGDLDLRLELPTSWACGGHPTRDLPTTLGGVELPADPDWRAIVARSFKAEAPDGAPHFWARWLPEVYGQLSGTPHPQAINSVIADLMVSSDDALRTGALYFLWDSLDVPAVDLLPHVLLEDAETLHGQRDARGPTDLYDVACRVVAYQVRRGRLPWEGGLRDALRMHLLQPGGAAAVAGILSEQDPDWLLEHFELAKERSPNAAAELERGRREILQRRALLGR
jgi:hypothetical protein